MERGQNTGERAPEEWVDLTLSIEQVLYLAGRWLPAITILAFLPHLLIWGLPSMPDWPALWQAVVQIVMWSAIALVVYAVSAMLHEGLHLAAMVVVARVPLSSLQFGMRLSEGVLYVHTSRAMSARAYRIVLLLPSIVLGLIPIGLGTLGGAAWAVVYGYVMLVSSIGDLVVLQLLRRLDADTLVRDHPEQIGCQVRVQRASS